MNATDKILGLGVVGFLVLLASIVVYFGLISYNENPPADPTESDFLPPEPIEESLLNHDNNLKSNALQEP